MRSGARLRRLFPASLPPATLCPWPPGAQTSEGPEATGDRTIFTKRHPGSVHGDPESEREPESSGPTLTPALKGMRRGCVSCGPAAVSGAAALRGPLHEHERSGLFKQSQWCSFQKEGQDDDVRDGTPTRPLRRDSDHLLRWKHTCTHL